ncbi:MAG: V-type ATP synthase subunit F [Oscillospiraceae bacterium]|jgi:V/A-type H+-transporting ATPase subunit F|nr:V-type ATP synthase subunit F [Oscillospiraceae bacterium]
MNKLAVIGSIDTVLGFRALGLDTFPASDADGARSALRHVTSGDASYAIVYIEEKLGVMLASELDRHRSNLTPAIVLIPGREGATGAGLARLRESVIRAVGADILQ